jgi:hypothetical protein
MAKNTDAVTADGADTSVQSKPEAKAETKAETKPEEAPKDPRLTPRQWADSMFPRSQTGRLHPERWKHGAAAALHQWAAYAHNSGRQIELTRSEYQAALDAACKPNPAPHPAALGSSRGA